MAVPSSKPKDDGRRNAPAVVVDSHYNIAANLYE